MERSRRNVQVQSSPMVFTWAAKNPTSSPLWPITRGAFGSDPLVQSATSFDTAEILISLLQESQNQSRDKLRAALSQLKNYDGVTGMTSFGPDREVQKQPFLLTVEGDRIVEVLPRTAKSP